MRSPGITGSSNLAKILLSTLPVPGHVKPAISAAGKLQHAGHEVVFALPETLGLSVPADIRFVATGSANFDDGLRSIAFEGATVDDTLDFFTFSVTLALNNFASEDDVFDVEDGEAVVFNFFVGMMGHHIVKGSY